MRSAVSPAASFFCTGGSVPGGGAPVLARGVGGSGGGNGSTNRPMESCSYRSRDAIPSCRRCQNPVLLRCQEGFRLEAPHDPFRGSVGVEADNRVDLLVQALDGIVQALGCVLIASSGNGTVDARGPALFLNCGEDRFL